MKKKVKLIFPQHLVKEPVIFTMAKTYDVIPNIRRARVTDSGGEMILELDGPQESLDKGIESLRSQGVEVALMDPEDAEWR
ncbi:MAG TPA: NIL domain-containing protein [Dissulfurispiraceae bacterium]|nr:NIL domain-containing protein [Dissulfurispiraceae bacterium]